MLEARIPKIMRTFSFLIAVLFIGMPAQAKYAGGTGEPNDPYQIATASDLMLLGESPEDYDKHFILTADIDLDPNLPGGKVFDEAVIAPTIWFCDRECFITGPLFTGVFDGNGHTISNFTYVVDINEPPDEGYSEERFVGLFGYVYGPGAQIKNLGLIDPNIYPETTCIERVTRVGALAGRLRSGAITNCYVQGGRILADAYVGGLVGSNLEGTISECYATCDVALAETRWLTPVNDPNIPVASVGFSFGGLVGYSRGYVYNCFATGSVKGATSAGGLVGFNDFYPFPSETELGIVSCSYAAGAVSGKKSIGGLVGRNRSVICDCYATGGVTANDEVGGLVGVVTDTGSVEYSFSTGSVLGDGEIGGLVGWNYIFSYANVINCFWDKNTSFQQTSKGGTGLTTSEMQTADTFLNAGWDFVGETTDGTDDIWWILEGQDYPRLWWQLPSDDFGDGQPGPLWFVYAMEPELAWLQETNGRLEVNTTGLMEDVDAIYVSDGWRLDATRAFAVRVDFHFGKVGVGDGRLTLGLVPTIEEPVVQWAQFEAGTFDDNPFYLYEVRDGTWVEEKVTDRFSDDGTLYVSYDPESDELHLSDTGYGKANAMWIVEGLVRGRWQSESVYITLGGGCEGMALTGEDAWLDNFTVNAGAILQ